MSTTVEQVPMRSLAFYLRANISAISDAHSGQPTDLDEAADYAAYIAAHHYAADSVNTAAQWEHVARKIRATADDIRALAARLATI